MLVQLSVGHKEFTELLTFTGIKWHLRQSKCQEDKSVRVYDVNIYIFNSGRIGDLSSLGSSRNSISNMLFSFRLDSYYVSVVYFSPEAPLLGFA